MEVVEEIGELEKLKYVARGGLVGFRYEIEFLHGMSLFSPSICLCII